MSALPNGGFAAICLAVLAWENTSGAIVVSPDQAYDVGGSVFTLDPAENSPGSRGITNARNLRQTFQLSDQLNVEQIVLSVVLNGSTDDLIVRMYEIADVRSQTWLAGRLVHTFSVSTSGISSASNIRLSFSGADGFWLPARSDGTQGYGIELTQSGGSSIGALQHSNTGSDLFSPGNFYTETGVAGSTGSPNTTRDVGLSIAGSVPSGDADNDGLGDPWEERHFGNGDGTATTDELALQDGFGDPDGDGFSNEEEETAATDPNDGAAFPGGADFRYVATNGDDANPGTIDKPFATVARAQQAAAPGTTVYFRGGTYAIDVDQVAQYDSIFARVFLFDKSGASGNPIRYWAYPGEQPTFDLTAVNPPGYRVYTFYVTANWLHFRGLTVTGVQVNILTHTQSICFDNEGSSNIYERLVMRDNQAIGLWIGNGSNNLVLNCDAYRNWDSTSEGGVGGNVDGFGCHGSADTGNVFRGCRAWLNSDDGFDLINVGHPVVIENCWAAYNGLDSDFVSRGDGNGFKAGGYGSTPAAKLPIPIPRHVVRDCMAVGNKQSGFYANHHPGGVTFIGNTALRNKRNFNMLNRTADNSTDVPGYDHILRNNLGFNATLNDLTDVDLAACDHSHNSFDLAVVVDASDFESIDEFFLTAPRQADGKLPVVPLMHLVSTSDLIDQGLDEGIPFAGLAPDLGCFERDSIEVGNFDFSLPVATGTRPSPDAMIWSFGPDAGVSGASGEVRAYLGASGTLEQTFDGFEAGETYHVRLLASASPDTADFEWLVDGVSLANRRGSSGADLPIDAAFVANSFTHTLRFAATGSVGGVQIASVGITRVTADSDSDIDGLGDAWEFAWFGDLEQEPADDPDGDSTANIVEEILELDPTSGTEAFRIILSSDGELSWPGAAGIDFEVERSTALGGWVGIAVVGGKAGMTSYRDPSPPPSRAFYRVSFRLP